MQLPDQLVQAIINYLTTKPYSEVAPLLNEIVKCLPKEEVKEEKKK